MIRVHQILTGIVAATMFAVAAPVFAKAHHNNGQQLLGSQIKVNGNHKIHQHGKYSVSVEVNKGKVAGVSVKHAEKGNVPVKKYKTKTKLASADGIQYVSFTLAQAQDLGTTYIGYSFIDENGDEVIYWFPYEMILDGDTGAVDYVPLA